MNTKRVVITGSPATGKTSIINELIKRGYVCLEEISRQIILNARKKGIKQLFLDDPLRFSELLLEGRKSQFLEIQGLNTSFVFYDRGIPDILAYMNYANASYPKTFTEVVEYCQYDLIFILPPWKDIFRSDNERYENFEQANMIHKNLVKSYTKYGYDLIDIPFGTVEHRTDFILNHLKII